MLLVPGVGFWILNSAPESGATILNSGPSILDSGSSLSDSGFWISDSGSCSLSLDPNLWILGSGP